MATSLLSTGVQFPDSTIQTTAASGGSSLQAVASGALSDGSMVVINADGTVSVIKNVPIDPPVAGTKVVFESATTSWISATYDSTNNKVVVAYQDGGNANRGTAIVGTVSGTSISFGTPTVFNTSTTSNIATTFDSNANKVVIFYVDYGNSYYGTAIVGTVSGTSISFGTRVVVRSVEVNDTTATFDSNANKVVLAYRDVTGGNVGTAIVGTVSGTSISFGTPTVFYASTAEYISATFDSVNNKVVITYGTNNGRARVGTVSGTSISFGTEVVFQSGTVYGTSATFDSNTNKVVVAYRNPSNYGAAIVGTVSGTSISFGTSVTFNSVTTSNIAATFDSVSNKVYIAHLQSNSGTVVAGTVSGTSISFGAPVIFNGGSINYLSTTFDSNANKVVFAYRDGGNSNFGTMNLIVTEGSNLTSENFIGVSNGAYANGATATIQIAGSIDDAQSGLTAGQDYFVQTDGTLSEAPGLPFVFAGKALSATELIVQGPASPSGSWVLLQTQSVNSVANIDFAGIPSGYNSVAIVIHNLIGASGNFTPGIRFGTGSTTYQTSGYYWRTFNNYGTASSGGNASSIAIRDGSANNRYRAVVYVQNLQALDNNYVAAIINSSQTTSTSDPVAVFGSGFWNTLNTPVTALRIFSSSGELITGLVSLYGIKG